MAAPRGTSSRPTSMSASPMPCCSCQTETCRLSFARSAFTGTLTTFIFMGSSQFGLLVARVLSVRADMCPPHVTLA